MSQVPQMPPQGSPPSPAATGGNGVAVAGMVLGIIAILTSCLPIVGLACGVVGLILSCIGMKKAAAVGGAGKGMAIAGLVCSIIGLLWGVFYLIYWLVVGTAFLAFWSTATQQMQQGPQPIEELFRLPLLR